MLCVRSIKQTAFEEITGEVPAARRDSIPRYPNYQISRVPKSIEPQCHYRIHSRRTPCWYVAGERRHDQ